MKTTVAACLLAALVSGAIAAQPYPTRPVRMIMPTSPGGANDVMGRIVAQRLTEILGQQMVIDNRSGAGGAIGAEIAAGAAPDGYTLLVATFATHTMVPLLHKKIGYDPVRDFVPVALYVVQYNMLSANPNFAPNTVKELIALAKAKPGAINYASAGPGSTSHFTGLAFAKTAGIDVTIVPYKGGGPAIAALLAGEAQFNFGPLPATVPLIKSGRLKPIAVSGATRAAAMPDVPTVSESGLAGFTAAAWVGLAAPAKTPQSVIKRLAAAVEEAVNSSELRQRLIGAGAEPSFKAPSAFAEFLREDREHHGKLVRELRLSPN